MPAPGTPSCRCARRTAVLLAGLTAVILTGCIGPPADTVDGGGGDPTGAAAETTLEHDVRTTFDDDFERAAVAVVDDGEVETVFAQADEDTMFEIGSLTKVLTGELLAMAVERGEVALDDPLGRYLPLGDAPAASVTLVSLATHSSGLPAEPTDAAWVAEADAAFAARHNPFNSTLDELLELTRHQALTVSEEPVYSNLGAALLGHALAAAAGTDYATLLETRVFEPLGMDHAVLVQSPEQVPTEHAGGFTTIGQPVDPWFGSGFAPAGAVHATLDDVVALAQAVIDGPLSDSAALEPAAPGFNAQDRLGYFWWLVDERPRTLTAHQGFTGGFASSLMIDRDAEQASIVLVNVGREVGRYGLRFLVDADHDD
jgi:CubicO group peptidase (beta-lactamase class C family)